MSIFGHIYLTELLDLNLGKSSKFSDGITWKEALGK